MKFFSIKNVFSLGILFSVFLINQCLADIFTVGSDYTIQSHYIFNYGKDNLIANDAVMENGFTLTARTESISDATATCSIDSYFPVKGFTSLNGGELYLNRDLIFDDIFTLGSAGKVYGNGYSITFPASENIVGVPSSINRGGRVRDNDSSADLTTDVLTVDWSCDDKYIASGKNDNGGDNELNIFSFDGGSLTSRAGVNLSLDVRSLSWNPSSYDVAIATNEIGVGNPLRIYKYIPPTSLTLTASDHFDSQGGRAVAWTGDGKYLAASMVNNHMRVYSFTNDTISLLDEVDFSAEGSAQGNSLDWNFEGNKIAVGVKDVNANLIIYNFDGTSLTLSSSLHIPGASIAGVDGISWKKNGTRTDLLAIALGGTEYLFKVCSNVDDTITIVSEYVTGSDNTRAVHWDVNGDRIAAGKVSTADYDFSLFYFNLNTDELDFVEGFFRGADGVFSVKFSHDGKYIATGDQENKVYVFDLQQNYGLFDNTNLVFNSDAEFIVTTTFSGNCTINGKGNKVYLNERGSFNVASGGQLKLQNLELVGVAKTNLQCLAGDASVIFEDCIVTITSDYTFDTGSILFQGDVVISGTNKFIYSSSWSSTIDSNSTLIINKGATFSYAPSVAARDLMYMENDTSLLYLDNCTLHSTTTGLRLTRGTLYIENLVTLDADGDDRSEAICFGNINYTTSDLEINILAGANLDVYGRLEYENSN